MSEHDHVWSQVGCWTTDTATNVTLQSPALCVISNDDWLAYLQSLPSERRHDVVALAARGGKPTSTLLQECRSWLSKR
jgi:hypothetical protein